MNREVKDLTGQVFGQLTVIKFAGITNNGANNTISLWKCKCSCGNVVERSAASIRSALRRGYESVCSHSCKKRTVRVNKKTYVKVADRVGAKMLLP